MEDPENVVSVLSAANIVGESADVDPYRSHQHQIKSVVRSWRIGGTEENLQVTAKTTDPKTHTPLTYSNSTSRIQMQTTGGRGVEQSSVSLAREKGTQNTEWMNANTMNKQHKKAQNIDGKQESPESDC